MAQLLNLADFRPYPRIKSPYFGRLDLNQLLGIYASQVAKGHCRDYAIDHLPDRAVFSIFRRAQEVPLFQIAKWKPRHGTVRYVLLCRAKQLKSSRDLPDILEVLKEMLDKLS